MTDSIIRLNVGGVPYDTTKSTLCQTPGSMLERMFNGPIGSKKIEGRYFIDRNGPLFLYILDFLRNSELWTPPSDLDVCRQLLLEAQFYGLSPLVELLQNVTKGDQIRSPGTFLIDIDNHTIHLNTYTSVEIRSKIRSKFANCKTNGPVSPACEEIINIAYNSGYMLISNTHAVYDNHVDHVMLTFALK